MQPSVQQRIVERELKLLRFSLTFIASVSLGVQLILLSMHELRELSPDGLIAARIATVVIALAVLVLVAFRGRRITRGVGQALFLAIILPYVPVSWLQQSTLAVVEASSLFTSYKLLALVIAWCPIGAPWLINWLLAAFCAETLLIGYVYDVGSSHFESVTEPWFSLVFFIVAVAINVFRARHERLWRHDALLDARSSLVEHMARMFLTIRDRTRSPLQALELQLAQLEHRYVDDKTVRAMKSSLAKLIRLNQLFDELERDVRWDGKELLNEKDFIRSLKGP